MKGVEEITINIPEYKWRRRGVQDTGWYWQIFIKLCQPTPGLRQRRSPSGAPTDLKGRIEHWWNIHSQDMVLGRGLGKLGRTHPEDPKVGVMFHKKTGHIKTTKSWEYWKRKFWMTLTLYPPKHEELRW
jgi:hypothetical protein